MKLVVGLGNPGEKYVNTRHNVGFGAVEQFHQKIGGEFGKVREWQENKKFMGWTALGHSEVLLMPSTFMNKSGQSVSAVMRFYKIKPEDLYVIHDDLDIELGEYKMQFAKGPQLHYGVESIEQSLGTKEFWRVRVGVENREIRGNKGIPGEAYSLQEFMPPERKLVGKVVEQVVEELVSVLS